MLSWAVLWQCAWDQGTGKAKTERRGFGRPAATLRHNPAGSLFGSAIALRQGNAQRQCRARALRFCRLVSAQREPGSCVCAAWRLCHGVQPIPTSGCEAWAGYSWLPRLPSGRVLTLKPRLVGVGEERALRQ